ncbi:MAG: NADH:ubiquinone reductase (Na(+)-transporting) subunit B [Cobetia sp.]|jgi:Na+-transporting NADH:ubiquinone oxidoreductase subunit B|uniref:Na(+)-translocating NADH-quinone reductase subunit B n=1 Tax=Cobetia amphilecti TaxID=1055104 RepID=A0AAP4WXJ1_9GAMM|nr:MULTISPECIES: NADH:ubiquinone reductase (Na(+)-transporting) subunit B [Cobetia]AVV33427.1 NADH:ubiquinone reductase (Na(+)-transporting) subunit B [Halomonas sp. SF2003]MBR9753797.1 NADH:ubiquinone reductase (Na(+)-transporting) subunit B [Gammaproteobacteria bacterium]TCJ25223.1 NADH:ubiquinone reductase (Na(+)-transporting) subunit B [Halomonas sp. GDM18]KGA03068.1 Na(+)-translocating NADH-quinone reductase subunit B [Cobetia amphilecti]KPM81984.1 Na(+)-translocating NADH-quinone reducta|tara:strand:+ start:831 stop:2063 length:1233 start_codon:yes stop_codon:yes gene_type:complete
MMGIRQTLDNLEPHFHKGGKYEKFYALYEAVDTIFYAPASVTRSTTHVRDGIDLKRIMITVWMCTFPAMFFGMYNAGLQANEAIAGGYSALGGWREAIVMLLAGSHDAGSVWANFILGATYFLPIYLVTFAVGGFWEVLFAMRRGHEVNEGFFVTSVLFALTLPATIPLWQVALGITFGVVIGKEVFGGTGKNFLNPALSGRAFLYFAYPASISGDAVWVPADGFTGATALSTAAQDGMGALMQQMSWTDAFLGFIPGSVGEVSTLAIFLGAAVLLWTRIASWRIMLGVLLGMIATSALFNAIGSDTNAMFEMPWYWHMVIGGFAFGMVFMATDPVSASMTNKGKLVFGALIGVMTVLIRVANPAFPEGIMLAILFANLFAPLIDHFVVQANIKRRVKRETAGIANEETV